MKKRFVAMTLCLVMLFSCVLTAVPALRAEAATTYEQSLLNAGFPQSYVTKLSALHDRHPNWKFEPLLVTKQKPAYTWSYVIGKETENDQRNLIYHSYSSKAYALDSTLVESGLWYKCNKATVEFFMDPRNFLDEQRIFQFEALQFTGNYTAKDVANSIKGTFMDGVTLENGKTYAQNFYDIGKAVNVSPFHLAARVKQEQGLGQSPLISGNCGTTLRQCYVNKTNGAPATGYDNCDFNQYNGLYNYFNIGAFGTGYFNIWLNGMTEAQTGGWNTRYKAIQGGAQKVHDMYVGVHQNTLYLQKFNVHPSSSKNFWGQYMQNVSAAWSESLTIHNAYKNNGLLDTAFTFIIPVYDGMPTSCPDPGGAFKANTPEPAVSIPSSLKSQVFDPEYYRNAHADLKNAFGSDEGKLYQHFLEFGIKEGRQAHPAFDVKYYLSANKDLAAAFGTDYEKGMNHFVKNGYKEGRTTAKPANLGDSFYAKITSVKADKNVSMIDGNVLIYNDSTAPAQVWKFERQSNGSYKIINMKDGKSVLHVNNRSSASGTNVCIAEDKGYTSQRWYVYKNGNSYILKPGCASLCALDVQNGETANKTNVQIYTVDGTPAQNFVISKTNAPSEPETTTVTYKVTSPYNTQSIGTYTSLSSAKAVANQKVQLGYVVYDSTGKLAYTPATSLNASKILWEAKIVADYQRDNAFVYGNATKNPYFDKSQKVVSCDRFVGWVLGNAGYVNGQPTAYGLNLYGSNHDLGYGSLEYFLKQHGFTKITDISQVKAGDIVFVGYSHAHTVLSAEMREYPQHVYIAASNYGSNGQSYRYDAGSLARIRSTQPSYEPVSYTSNVFRFAFRAPSTGNVVSSGSSTTTTPEGTTGASGVTLTAFQKKLVFDSTYYTNKYPDLKNAFGSDSTKLYDHFLNFGIKEGRQAHPVFNVKYYLSQHKDLQDVFGDDYARALNHYVNIGYKENRKTAELVDLGENFYANITPAAVSNMAVTLYSTKYVVISDANDAAAQVWNFIRQSDGSYKIVNMKTGTKILTASDNANQYITIADNNDSKEQRWFIYEKNGTYVLKCADSQYSVLDLNGNKTADNTSLVYSEVDGAKTQRWRITKTSAPVKEEPSAPKVTYSVVSPYNTKSIGTYTSLESAKSAANSRVHMGYVVYDSTGKFVYTPATSLNASKILWEAKIVADYQRDNGWTYGNASKNPYYDKSQKIVSCDRYVGWVMGNAGYISGQPATSGLNLYGHKADMGEGCLETFLKQHGFTKITDINQVQAGDVVFVGYSTAHTSLSQEMRQYPQHVFIAASGYLAGGGQTYRYDAGSNNRIRSNQPSYEPLSYSANPFRFAYRAPATGNTTQAGSSVTTNSNGTTGESGVTLSAFQKKLVFDPTYYSNKYPDLKAAFGSDATKLYTHFMNFGIKEGRQAHPLFDVKYYLTENSDLKAAFGKDYAKGINHYVTTGYEEGRKTAAPVDLGTNFYAKIQCAKKTGMVLGVSGTNVNIYESSSAGSQVWKFVRQSNGSYKIINMGDGKSVLDASATAMKLATSNTSTKQNFYFYEKNGTYVIMPAFAKYEVLDLASSSLAAGSNVIRDVTDGAATQRFRIEKTSAPTNGTVKPTAVTYRVTSPYNTSCIGTFTSLAAAKSVASSKVQLGYVVYDSTGKLVFTPATSLNASKILWEAKLVADYQKANNWVYGDASVNPFYDKSQRVVSCDRFVGWVLGNAGFVNGQPATRGLPLPGHNLDLQYNSLESFLKLHGFTKITNMADVKAGDVVFVGYCYNHTYLAPQYRSYPQHVFIAASNYNSSGQTYRYDDGSLTRIRSTQPFYEPLNYSSNPFRFAYRPPSGGTASAATSSTKVSISSAQKSLVFDATYYSNKYSDLKAAYGTDATKLYNHFITHGVYEGRQGCAAFDVKTYLNKYDDLQKAFGKDYAKALNHYLTHGYNEGRRAPA
ncbi:MAG: hypothetical protein E7563_00305 [Ruminococcaceae bacterium]|nr:hypothetical protein [Oscillospiraceae bacterium]